MIICKSSYHDKKTHLKTSSSYRAVVDCDFDRTDGCGSVVTR